MLMAMLLLLAWRAPYCSAQTIGQLYSGNGLVVSGSQTVTAKPTILRCIATLREQAEKPDEALASLNKLKQDFAKEVRSIQNISEPSIKFSSPTFHDWVTVFNMQPRIEAWPASSNQVVKVAIKFDVELRNFAPEAILTLPHRVAEKLNAPEIRPDSLMMVYVGEIEQQEQDRALQLAYDRAMQQAERISELTHRKLGKLKQLAPSESNRAELTLWRAFGSSQVGTKAIPVEFEAEGNEVYGVDPTQVEKCFAIQLRFNMK